MVSKKTKCLSLCSVLCALGVVVLLLGSFVEVIDLTVAMLASVLTIIAVIECGKSWPWLVYAVTALLSLLLLSYKVPAVMYLFAGYYPIVKEKLESLRRLPAWLLKFLLLNISLTVIVLLSRAFIPQVDFTIIPGVTGALVYIVLYVAGNLTFLLYDIMLTRVISLYLYKLRKKLGFK